MVQGFGVVETAGGRCHSCARRHAMRCRAQDKRVSEIGNENAAARPGGIIATGARLRLPDLRRGIRWTREHAAPDIVPPATRRNLADHLTRPV